MSCLIFKAKSNLKGRSSYPKFQWKEVFSFGTTASQSVNHQKLHFRNTLTARNWKDTKSWAFLPEVTHVKPSIKWKKTITQKSSAPNWNLAAQASYLLQKTSYMTEATFQLWITALLSLICAEAYTFLKDFTERSPQSKITDPSLDSYFPSYHSQVRK